ncbi:MAG: hypothetical protein DCC75_07625 [Proteobacteria bacterium]|nr:MAG: hypothetical protein DCC75_07625 [Pseudomonadota bacterium]
MGFERLQIKHLSKSGELLGVISCYAGQVSVLRSSSLSELKPYQRALAGIPGAEKFSITLDDLTFQPEEHTEGKVLVLNDPFEPIANLWRERAAELIVSSARGKGLLVVVPSLSYRPQCWIDNEAVARIQVGQNVQRTIGFSAAGDDVSSVVSQVRQEYSAAGRGAEGTGGGGEKDPSRKDSGPTHEKLVFFKRDFDPFLYILAAVLILALGVGISLGVKFVSSDSKPEDGSEVASLQNKVDPAGDPKSSNIMGSDTSSHRQDPSVAASAISQAQLAADIALNAAIPAALEPTDPPAPSIVMLLDRYPAEIRNSVLETFDGGSVAPAGLASPRLPRVMSQSPQGRPDQTGLDQHNKRISPKARSASDLLNLLQSASGSGDGLPDQAPRTSQPALQHATSDLANLDPEQRREVIRQKFLEAIQRAAEQKQQ